VDYDRHLLVRTLSTLRRWLLGLSVLGLVGTGVELVLLEHYEDTWQLVPLVLIVLTLSTLAWHGTRHSSASLRSVRAAMALCVAAGLVGIVLHLRGAAEFQREMDPSQSRWSVFKKAMRAKSPPVLAAGAMIELGLLGFAYAYVAKAAARGGEGD
jgi:hypothetical protein